MHPAESAGRLVQRSVRRRLQIVPVSRMHDGLLHQWSVHGLHDRHRLHDGGSHLLHGRRLLRSSVQRSVRSVRHHRPPGEMHPRHGRAARRSPRVRGHRAVRWHLRRRERRGLQQPRCHHVLRLDLLRQRDHREHVQRQRRLRGRHRDLLPEQPRLRQRIQLRDDVHHRERLRARLRMCRRRLYPFVVDVRRRTDLEEHRQRRRPHAVRAVPVQRGNGRLLPAVHVAHAVRRVQRLDPGGNCVAATGAGRRGRWGGCAGAPGGAGGTSGALVGFALVVVGVRRRRARAQRPS